MRKLSIALSALLLTPVFAQNVYFPKKALGSSPRLDELKQNWYTSQLQALQEPSLFQMRLTPSAESYRFLWLRSFNQPIAIRLDLKADGTSFLIIKLANGAGGFHPGTLTQNDSRVLSKDQTQIFLSKLNSLNFWKLPNPVNDQGGTDGSQWIIEGLKGGDYHVVDRWSPTKGPVYELGMFLVFDLAQLNPPKNDVY